MRDRSLKTTLLLSTSSFLLAVFLAALGQIVWYLDYLLLFNFLMVVVVSLSAAALITGAMGLWQCRGNRWQQWVASLLPIVWLWALFSFG